MREDVHGIIELGRTRRERDVDLLRKVFGRVGLICADEDALAQPVDVLSLLRVAAMANLLLPGWSMRGV